jgi:hypothetical protein
MIRAKHPQQHPRSRSAAPRRRPLIHPRSPHGVKAIFCFTVDSVSNAHRLQKFLHLSNFNRHMYGSRYPMQAEVW